MIRYLTDQTRLETTKAFKDWTEARIRHKKKGSTVECVLPFNKQLNK